MSFKAMAWAAEQQPPTATAKLALLMMASMADAESATCYPSYQYLADQCMVSRRTLIRTLQMLEDEGFIDVRQRNKNGSQTSNLYKLLMCKSDTGGVSRCHPPSDTVSPGGSDTVSPNTVTSFKQSLKQGEREPEKPDFSDWEPPAAIVQRIKMMRTGITDEFLDETLPEFLTFAESHYRRDQLESKFLANANRQWFRSQNKSKQGPPKDDARLSTWVKDNDAPPARVGESPYDYRNRLWEWINAGRPPAEPEREVQPVQAGAGLLDDHLAADMARPGPGDDSS